MATSINTILENRALVRCRLGPPDFYPQDPKQKEDELTSVNVKQGFINQTPIYGDNGEHGSAQHYQIDVAKLNGSFADILQKKQMIATYTDTGKKRPPLTKDNFWLVPVAKNRNHLQQWIKDLRGGKSLSSLGRRVPIYSKKEEIFQILAENQITIARGTWYIKMTAAYNVIQAEAKNKKNRITIDHNPDWTAAICRFMRDQLARLIDDPTLSSTALQPPIQYGKDEIEKHFNYTRKMAHHMYKEGMLDRHEFLSWVVETMEKIQLHGTTALSYVMPLITKYTQEIAKNQLLSRRIAFVVCRLLGWLLNETTWSQGTAKLPQVGSPIAPSSVGPPSVPVQPAQKQASAPSTPGQPLKPSSPQKGGMQVHLHGRKPFSLPTNFPEFLEDIVYGMIYVTKCITLECPGALVWYPSDEPKILGSPLDYLPVPPSGLPLPPPCRVDKRAEAEDEMMRLSLQEKEHDITQRSYATEIRWSSDKCQESATGQTIHRVLSTLETLDKHQNFDRTDSVDPMYNKIFMQSNKKDANNQPTNGGEEAVIWLLCEWALSAKRLGEHRAAVVAKLLDKRQVHIESERAAEIAERMKAADSSAVTGVTSPAGRVLPHMPPQLLVEGVDPDHTELAAPPSQAQLAPELLAESTHLFQNLLFNFLDTQAPILANPSDREELQSFKNLVVLFSELIQHDVFSHDEYVNTLISRGDIVPGQIFPLPIHTPKSSATSSNALTSSINRDSNAGILSIPPVDPASGPISNKPSGDTEEDLPPSVRSLDPKNDSTDLVGLFSPLNAADFSSPENRHMGERHFTDGLATPRPDLSDNLKVHGQHHQSKRPPGAIWGYRQPRHVQFLMHFPISFEDVNSVHESNQRLMVLYGAGKQRNEVKKAVRKITKYVCKLVQKRSVTSTENSTGLALTPIPSAGNVGKKSKNLSGEVSASASVNSLLKRFRCLSYFDQHGVTSQATKAILSSFNDYVDGRSQNLPQMTSITLVLNLMKEGLNTGCMVQLAVQIALMLTPLEMEIEHKHPALAGCYTKDLALNVVAVLRHYQSYLTLNVELTLQAFDAMHSYIKHSNISNPGHCTSSDRCVLIFLYDLYSSFSLYRSKIVSETLAGFSGFASAIKQTLCQSKIPATSNCRYDSLFLAEYIENPNSAHPLIVARQHCNRLCEATNTYKYSFVCSAIIAMCSGQPNPESLSAIATLCAEMNAQCNDLSSEWLGVLKALCCSSCTANFNDVLLCVDLNDATIRDPLALFTAILIARNCLSLEDFIQHVAIPSLLAACPSKPGLDVSDAEIGARLTCHILLQLFKTPTHPTDAPESEISQKEWPSFYLPEAADRHLLAASQRNIVVGAVLAVLKAIVKLGDSTFGGRCSSTALDNDAGVTSFLAPIGGLDEFDEFSLNGPRKAPLSASNSLDKANLSQFAKHAVRVICSQQWVRERCLKNVEWDLLMDPELTREQRQNLIQLICCPEKELQGLAEDFRDQYSYVLAVLQRMSRWTLRQTLLELQIMLEQAGHDESLSEDIAKAIVDVFKTQNMETTKDRKSPLTGIELDRSNIWLMPPLVSELSSQVQAKVLHETSMILETFQHHWFKSKSDRDRNSNKNSASLLSQQPFLTLILTCLKGQDEQRDSLLDSLQSQIIMFHSDWGTSRRQNLRDSSASSDGSMAVSAVQEALQLRLSLMGGMFDTVQHNSHWTSSVIVLLTQLISSGMVDVEVNAKLFNTVVDMIAVLLHYTLGGDSPGNGEGSKRDYMTIVKKIKKEIGDGQSVSLNILRRLLPVPRKETYVIAVEATMSGSEPTGQHKVASKHKLVPWDIIDGLKNTAPLCLSWFGARRTERKELPYEVQRRLMLLHDHGSWQRPALEYMKPPALPEEEEEKQPSPPRKRKPSSALRVKSPSGGAIPGQKDALQPLAKKAKTTQKPRKNLKKEAAMQYNPRMMGPASMYNRTSVMLSPMAMGQTMPASAVQGFDGNPGGGYGVLQSQLQPQPGNSTISNKVHSAHIKQNLAHLIKTKTGQFGQPQQQPNPHQIGGMHLHPSQTTENSKSAIRTMIARSRMVSGPTSDMSGMAYRPRQPGSMGPPISTMRQLSNTGQQPMGGYNSYMNSQQSGMGQVHMMRPSYNSYQGSAVPPQQQGYHQPMQSQSYISQTQNQGYSMSGMAMQGVGMNQGSGYGMQAASAVQNQPGMMTSQQPPQYGVLQSQQQGRPLARMNPQQQMSGPVQGGMVQMHGMSGGQNEPMNRHVMMNQYGHRMTTPSQQTSAQMVTLRRNLPNQNPMQGSFH